MIKSIKYVATFSTTNRTLKNQLNFKPGLTIIKGDNETGKSFVLEMIRYALFGSEALRGSRSDYSKLEVRLEFEVKSKTYIVNRVGGKATLNNSLAVGASSVNAKIREILGFDLKVFDIACNIPQKKLSSLTEQLGPTERRRIVDEVTGLTQFEKAEKECREKALEYKKMADAVEAQLVKPLEPAKPDDYEPSKLLKERLDNEIRRSALESSLTVVAKPDAVTMPKGSEDSIQHEKARRQWLENLQVLKQRLDRIPSVAPKYSVEELNEYREALDQQARGPVPEGIDRGLLEQWRIDHRELDADHKHIKCPECDHEFLPEGRVLPERPSYSIADIDAEIERQRNWEGATPDVRLLSLVVPITANEISNLLAEWAAMPMRIALEQQIADMGEEPEDRSLEADSWIEYNSAMMKYAQQEKEYLRYCEAKAVIDALPAPEPFLQEKYEMSLRYETLLARYEATKQVYEDQKEKLQALKENHIAYKNGSEAMKTARSEVKRYLIPSLAKVASYLLYQMTAGQRRKIEIDEKFEITVDNQPVNTLSGSGVSVANLALRIALGKVLTQSVVPLLLADEIDADMAETRAEATFESLKKLKSELTQMIIVTHKDLKGDYEICLT